METIKDLKYPENEVWYILVRDLVIISYGKLEPNQVLSTVANIDIYETEEEWKMVLADNGIDLTEILIDTN